MKTNRPKTKSSSIIDDGFRDPTNFTIDPILKLALSDDPHEFGWAVQVLRAMYNHGRTEAGVFLVGLLRTCGDKWEKRRVIANALFDLQTEAVVHVMFDELRQVKNTNWTRRYLRELIDVLSSMPPSLVRSGFEELAQDKSLTDRMRAKFRAAEADLAYRQLHGLM